VHDRSNFFSEAITIRGSATPRVRLQVLTFGVLSVVTCCLSNYLESRFGWSLKLEVGWFELAGAAVSLLLLMRTNGGYERWWDARKLWGSIVNQSRGLAISGMAYGPDDRQWKDRFVRLCATFPMVCRASLRGESTQPRVAELVGKETADRIERAKHRPGAVLTEIAHMLDHALQVHGMNGWAFAQVDLQRAAMIDHIGGCERILKTPLPRVYSIAIRRLITLFLATLPLVLLNRISHPFLIPLLTMAVAYPLIELDSVGHDIQNPFRARGFAPLPLEDIESTIAGDVLDMLRDDAPPARHQVSGSVLNPWHQSGAESASQGHRTPRSLSLTKSGRFA
jgi:putative membrane protein